MQLKYGFCGLLLLGLVAGCHDSAEGEGSGTPSASSAGALQPTLVRAARPTLRRLDRLLEVTGQVQATRRAQIAARVSGVNILQVLKDVGDVVAKQEPLAILEDDELLQKSAESAVAAREAQVRVQETGLALEEFRAQKRGQAKTLQQKKKSLDRLVAQEAGGAAAGMDLDAAQAAHDKEVSEAERLTIMIQKAEVSLELARLASEAAELTHKKAQRELTWARVLAPFDGIVSQRSANVGQLTGGGESSLFEIFDPSSLVIEVHIPQGNLKDMRPGLLVTIKAEAFPGRTLEGQVAMVSPVVEMATGTVLVRIAPRRPEMLKPGLFVAGSIVLETHQEALCVPRKAVGYERERPFIFLIEEEASGQHVVRRVWFQEGLSSGDVVEFLQPAEEPARVLRTADTIVLVGQDRLRDGDLVRLSGPVPEAEPPLQKTSAGSGG